VFSDTWICPTRPVDSIRLARLTVCDEFGQSVDQQFFRFPAFGFKRQEVLYVAKIEVTDTQTDKQSNEKYRDIVRQLDLKL